MGFTHLAPSVTEMTAVAKEYPCTGVEQIGDSCFPCSVACTGVPDQRPRIRHIVVEPHETGIKQHENSVVPKSMAGLAIARRTRSGMLLGPGFWMKVRPLTISKVSPFNARGVARLHQLHTVLRRLRRIWSSAMHLMRFELLYRPWKSGSRLSTKAWAASLWSRVCPQ